MIDWHQDPEGFLKFIVSRFTFRPGAGARLEYDDGQPDLVVWDRYPDSCKEGAPVVKWEYHSFTVGIDVPLGNIMIAADEEAATKVVMDFILEVFLASALHEIMEWGRLDGHRFYHPHVSMPPLDVRWPIERTPPAWEDYLHEAWAKQ